MARLAACLVLLLGLASPPLHGAPAANVAFYYGDEAPLGALLAYDWVVLQQDRASDARVDLLARGGTKPLSYISLGEVARSHRYVSEVQPDWVMGENPDWQSLVLDLRQSEVRAFLLERLIAPAMARGFQGIFLDTMDSHLLTETGRNHPQAFARAQHQLLEAFRERYPEATLVINRGFHLPPESEPLVDALAFESYRQGYDAGRDRFTTVSDSDRLWLDGQLARWRQARPDMPLIAIDYVAEADQAPALARQLRRDGFVPYVTDPDLIRLGPAQPRYIPRHVLVLHDLPGDLADQSVAHRRGGVLLERLGLVPHYRSIHQDLPREPASDRYAGILLWQARGDRRPGLCDWLLSQQREGVPVVLMGQMGAEPACRELASANAMGLAQPPLSADKEHASVGNYEGQRLPAVVPVQLPRSEQGRPWIRLTDSQGRHFHPVYSHAGGGVALAPYLFEPGPDAEAYWLFDPIAFLREAFDLAPFPAIDTTTESGRRILTSHIDGDAFISRGEFPGSPLSARVFIDEILNRYPLPRTVSVIEAEVSPEGLYPQHSEEVMALARRIFRHPDVAVASHTYSHPFFWGYLEGGRGPDLASTLYGYFMAIPGYQGSVEREVEGSVDFINRHLAPPEKPVSVFLWSGDARPGPEALRRVRQAGLVNVNGGDTRPLPFSSQLATVWPDARPVGDELQVYAPVMNENVYTNNWTGPFFGYRDAIESFRILEEKGRLKPMGIYYHFYSATRPDSLKALQSVYQYALSQPVTPLHLADYARRVQSHYRSALMQDGEGGYVWRGQHRPHTVRIAAGQFPDLDRSTGVAGYTDGAGNRYVHLTGERPRLHLTEEPPQGPWLDQANAVLSHWQREKAGSQWRITLGFQGHQPLEFVIAGTERCRVLRGPSTTVKAGTSASGRKQVSVTLPASAVDSLTLECR